MKATLLCALGAVCASAGAVSAGASALSPVLAYGSSGVSPSLLPETGRATSLTAFSDALFADDRHGVCSLDALVVVAADGLERASFARLRHAAPSLRSNALNAPTQVTFDAPIYPSDAALEERFARSWDSLCGGEAGRVKVRAGDAVPPSQTRRNLIQVAVADIQNDEEPLLRTLADLGEAYPRSLIVVAHSGSGLRPAKEHWKRQSSFLDTISAQAGSDNGNWTEPSGGLFDRYQLFSTPLILSLLVVFAILVPAVYIVVGLLSGVQTPDQIGVRKDPITGDKKNQ